MIADDMLKGCLDTSMPGQRNWSDDQVEVKQVDAQMLGQGGAVQVVSTHLQQVPRSFSTSISEELEF